MNVRRLAVQCCLGVSKEKSRSGRCTRVLQSRTDRGIETLFRKDFLRPFLSFLRTSLSHLHFLLQSSSAEDRSSLDAEVVPRLSSTTAAGQMALDVGRQEPLARPVCPATLTSKSQPPTRLHLHLRSCFLTHFRVRRPADRKLEAVLHNRHKV